MHFFGHEEINLLEAAQDGKLEFIQQQLASLTSKQLQEACKKSDYYGRNALHYAAYRGHYEVVEYFLNLHCLDLNSTDKQGNSALMLVCVRGYNQDFDESVEQSDLTDQNDFRKYKIAKLLLQRGATLYNYLKNHINNPLHWACYFGDLKLAQLLLIFIYFNQQIINQLQFYLLLLYYNPDLSKINQHKIVLKKNDRYQFPIDIALTNGKDPVRQKQVVKYLIVKFLAHFLNNEQYIIQLQQLNKDLEQGDREMIQDHKINCQKMDRKIYENVGLNYLFWASVLGDQDLVIPFLKQQFSAFAPSYKGRNAVHAATYQGHDNLVQLFFEQNYCENKKIQCKKLVNLMTIEKPQTALHIAVEQRHENIVNYCSDNNLILIIYYTEFLIIFKLQSLLQLFKIYIFQIIMNQQYLIKLGADHNLYNFRNQTAFASSRSIRIKELRQTLLRTEKNLIRSGYKYVLVGTNISSNLVKQQLNNIKENVTVGKFKAVPLKSYNESCIELKNEVAHKEKMMIYNFIQGIICPFNKDIAYMYENFHHYHDQQIILTLLYDEFNLDQFMHDQLLLDHFPLHDEEEKQLLYTQWKFEKWDLLKEPLSFYQNRCRTPSAIKAYFGSEGGFFFIKQKILFTLFVPAIPGIMLGVYIYATNRYDTLFVPIYTITLAVWATIFFEFWKRKQSETMFQFDMHVETEQKKKIQSFQGQFWIDDVTHKIEIQYSKRDQWKYYKTICPLILLGIIMITGEQIGYQYIIQLQERTTNFTIVCSIGLGISIKITNEIFNYFAKLSLKYENHQYQNELEDIYIMKVFSFSFLNSFVRLFYKSIIVPDADELNIMSITLTIVWAIVHLTRFTIIPLIKHHIRNYFLNKEFEQYMLKSWKKQFVSQIASVLDNNTEIQVNKSFDRSSMSGKRFLKSVEQNRIMMPMPNHVDQFTYFIIQFCMVTMFSASSQLIPVAILLFNIFTIDSLLYAYITFIKRPIAEAKRSIGLWNDILLIVGYIGTVINCLTIYQANQDQLNNLIGVYDNKINKETFALRNFLLLIAAEHIVIGLKFLIEQVIPDEPLWVTKMMQRQEYLYEQMLDKTYDSSFSSQKSKHD